MLIISIGIVMTLDGRAVRLNEAEKSLSLSIDNTLENLMKRKNYTICTENELIADLMESLLIQIESSSTVEINVLDADSERGLLSIEVVEKFQHPNGKAGTISAVKTVLFESDRDSSLSKAETQITITYLLPGNILYKEYTIKKGSEIIVPKSPYMEEKTFLHWDVNGKKFPLTITGNQRVKVDEDIILTAVFI